MQRDEARANSIITNTNSLHTALISHGYLDSTGRQPQNHFMHSFPLPLTPLGVNMNNSYTCAQTENGVTIANSDQIWNDTQINPTGVPNQFMEGFTSNPGTFQYALEYPKAANEANFSFETTNNGHEFMEGFKSNPGTFQYALAYPKAANEAIFSFETTNNGFECGLPLIGASNREGDFNNFLPSQELLEKVTRSYNQNEWVVMGDQDISPRSNNQLSSSLATSQPPSLFETSIHSEMSSSAVTSYPQQRRQFEHAYSSGSNLSSSFDSHNPFQLPSLLSGSRFVHAMQEILAEIAPYGLENFEGLVCYSSKGILDDVEVSGRGHLEIDGHEVEARMKSLFTLLQMVDERYNQCMDEIHKVISAFHAVTELDPNLHAHFALPTISFMFKNLRERISNKILSMGEAHSSSSSKGRETTRDEENSSETSFLQKQWAPQQLRKRDHQLWRPQRGLPERSVSVLRAWMFQNFLHPYPKDEEKCLLALKSGLSRSQVSNWFINARVRLWKPMIEEMYAEMNGRKTRRNNDEIDGIQRDCIMGFENRRFAMG